MKELSHLWLAVLVCTVLTACSADDTRTVAPVAPAPGSAVAVFAGGCFWCMEPPFDKLPGVLSTTSGYAGGKQPNPNYKQVTAGGSGHLESVQVIYDPKVVTFEALLEVFWRNIDPLDGGGQFCDRGESYSTAVFVMSDAERAQAEASLQAQTARFEAPIQTRIRALTADGFYPAEDYHQDYYQRNPVRYKYYRSRCGRDQRLKEVWGAKSS